MYFLHYSGFILIYKTDFESETSNRIKNDRYYSFLLIPLISLLIYRFINKKRNELNLYFLWKT